MLNRQALLNVFCEEAGISSVGANAIPTELVAVTREERIAEFRALYQAYSLNRKANSGGVSEEQRQAARHNFTKLQAEMKAFNASFEPCGVLAKARDIIHALLPPFAFVEDDVWPLCTFGPGTFHGAVKTAFGSSTHYKVGGTQTVTQRCKGLAIEVILNFFPNWAENLKNKSLITVEGNRPSHVPKDVRKCRPISIEPSLNVFLQQGVGRWLGRHLRDVGFADIFHGQAVNRRLASDLRNGTIDLSNASDTITLALVKYLLPADWFALLDCIRSHKWEYRKEVGTYENFSSQGNAFTFPLETMIFKAVVMAATGLNKKEVTVYGDDIILDASLCKQACEGLVTAGFTPNWEKSYWGQHDDERRFFRESCGADWYRGVLVTPVYYRDDVESDQDLAVLHNRFMEQWPGYERVLDYILGCAKRPLFGPRYIITDRPEQFLESAIVGETLLNSIVSIYDGYFWSSVESSNRRWSAKAKEMRPKHYIDERTAELTFLLRGCNSVPRRSSVNVRSFRPVAVEEGRFTIKVDARMRYLSRARSFLI